MRANPADDAVPIEDAVPVADELPVDPSALLTLLLADGRFPTGGHAQSAGVEAAVRAGDVRDLSTLVRYLRGRLATTGVTDAAFAAATVAACGTDGDELAAGVTELDREYEARVLSPHLAAASRRFGRQVVRTSRSAWPEPVLDVLADVEGGPHQPVALGAVVAAAGGDHRDAAAVIMHHLVGAVGTAGVRLLGLDPIAVAVAHVGETEFIAELLRPVEAWARSSPAELPAVGGTLTEILAEDHGSWEARLFVA